MLMHPQMLAGLPIWLLGMLLVGSGLLVSGVIEVAVRRLIPLNVRTSHKSAAAAIFNVVGTTYAVLLAFVAMLAWEGYDKAQAVTDTEASLVLSVYLLVDGLTGPEMITMRADIVGYANSVVRMEWPAQTTGRIVPSSQPQLLQLTRIALHLRPGNIGDGNLHTLLLDDLTQLGNVRRERLLIQRSAIPPLVWFVLMAGGGISLAFCSFLGASDLRVHLAMSLVLALSGTMILLLIVALGNPFRGELGISSEPLQQVIAQMMSGGR